MRTLAQLQADGFTVRGATDAGNCVEVLSAEPFWYYNTDLHATMQAAVQNFCLAEKSAEGWRFRAPGRFEPDRLDRRFPWAILDEARRDQALAAQADFLAAQAAADRAVLEFGRAIRFSGT